MFRNFTIVPGIALAITIGITVPVPGNSQESQDFVATYLNGLGQRLTLGDNQTDWSKPTDGEARKEIFDIAAQNNVCVSLLMTGQYESAKRSCERALHLGTIDLQRHDSGGSPSGRFGILAAISSNLGVVNMLLGDESKATANFAEARRMDPDQKAPKHNLAVLEAHRSSNTAFAVR